MKRYSCIYILMILSTLLCHNVMLALDLPQNAIIRDASWFSSYGKNDECSYESLLDSNPDSKFYSDTTKKEQKHYLEVKFPVGTSLDLADAERLFVVMTRPNRVDDNSPTSWNPTAMEIHYSFNDDGDYVKSGTGDDATEAILARVYFINRGSGTTELSEPLGKNDLNEVIKKQTKNDNNDLTKIRRLKFVITMNYGRVILHNTSIRPMIFGGFQLYKAKPGEVVVGNWVDRFHLKGDVHYDYEDYEFKNTLGVLDPVNRHTWGDGSSTDNLTGSLENFGGWDRLYDSSTGKRTELSKTLFEKLGLDIEKIMPDYSWVNRYNDPLVPIEYNKDDEESTTLYNTMAVRDANGLDLQPTATIEHLLYAIQGEPIALYPFYTLPGTEAYKEKFIHWYNYRDGKHVKDSIGNELLGFVGDPSDVFHSKEFGWYTSPYFKSGEKLNFMTIESVEDFFKFVKLVNDGNTTLSAKLDEDLDFNDQTVQSIGTENNPWRGTFLGNNHVISNFKIASSKEGVGLFAVTGDGAVITNLYIDDSCEFKGLAGPDNSGTGVSIVGWHKSGKLTLQGIVNRAEIIGQRNAGGFVGTVQSGCNIIIENSIFAGILYGPNGVENNIQNGYVIGWMRGSCNISIENVFIDCPKSMNFARNQIFRFDDDSYENYISYKNCSSPLLLSQCGRNPFRQIDNSNYSVQDYVILLGSSWEAPGYGGYPNPPVTDKEISAKTDIYPDRKFGTYATFFQPRDPFSGSSVAGADNMRPLERDEYVIAADMSQNFSIQYNVDNSFKSENYSGRIIEPIITFRHIFRVKDGYTFANTYMADKDGNDKFIQENRRHISASANKDFQIRLDHPYPVEKTTRGVFYYKIDDTDYRRICSRIIQVKDEDGTVLQRRKVCQMFVMDEKGQLVYEDDGVTPKFNNSAGTLVKKNGVITDEKDNAKDMIGDKILFYPSAIFDGQGGRNVDGTNYFICGGGGHFFRMLNCNASNASLNNGKPRTYTVQVIGTDYDNNVIHLADSPDHELMVQEFVITFLPEESSMMITENKLQEIIDSKARPDIAEIINDERESEDRINFDEYVIFEPDNLQKILEESNLNSSEFKSTDFIVHYPKDRVPVEDGQQIPSETQAYNYFRWPMPWSNSNYGFGYNTRGDYAMQMIVDNQAVTPNHSFGTLQDSSVAHKSNLKENQLVNNYGEGPGLFDRSFYSSHQTGDTEKYKRGYFFYVNAADDPGIIARLRADELCPGAKITVTCWLAEFTANPESANVSFNFVARLKNGKRVPMHAHVTGYVGQDNPGNNTMRNQWLFVYSSFVPLLTDKGISTSEVDHYEIEIDNNAKSSQGADYAIDDIRVYVDRPVIQADQLTPICSNDNVDVKISSDFSQLLENLAIQEPQVESKGTEVDLYYAIFDKKKFDAAEEAKKSYDEIFDESVIKIASNDNTYDTYGRMTFNTYFENNAEYKPNSTDFSVGEAYRWFDNTDGVNKIVFHINPAKRQMVTGREYIFAIITKAQNVVDNDKTQNSENNSSAQTTDNSEVPSKADWIAEGIQNKCAKKCELTLQGSSVIKIDGQVQQPVNEIDACRNQRPVAQIDLYAQVLDDDGNPVIGADGNFKFVQVDRNAKFDWFDGTMDGFLAIEENIDGKKVSLYEAIGKFRDEYPDYERVSNAAITTNFTQPMKDIIEKYSKTDPTGNSKPKLILSQTSYVFAPLVLPEGVTHIDKSIVAIPIPVEVTKNQLLCTQPTEVNVTVRQRAPFMAHGFKAIDYPKSITDVPLRLSIDQLNKAYMKSACDHSGVTPLFLPYRSIVPVTKSVVSMKESLGGRDFAPIFLAATNDPEYKDLFPSDVYDKNLTDIYEKENGDLWLVGEVAGLVADVDKEDDGYVKIEFLKDIKFKEGYWYSLRYLFEEQTPPEQTPTETPSTEDTPTDSDSNKIVAYADSQEPESGSNSVGENGETGENGEDTEEDFVCTGHVVFTLKVVPKYQKWNGLAASLSGEDTNYNWNNDDNWNRVAQSEIMFENQSDNRKKQFSDYLTDVKDDEGKSYNSQLFSYAPLYFTKTIIPKGSSNVPKMFAVLDGQYDIIEYGDTTLRWDKNPSGLFITKVRDDNSDNDNVEYSYKPELNGGAGFATSLVEYDMIERIESGGTYCRPWVANYCDEIHFEPGAEIGHQDYLNYNKAWVDMEVEPGRWYTLSSPLQGVVAGDMYLPTSTARQNTPYFDEMNFSFGTYNRFAPAVFQRSWNTASALVYYYDGQASPSNVKVETNWSHVYNDVQVEYLAGHGFSIKTDLYKMDESERPGSVLFRLPKADTEFNYYTEKGDSANLSTPVVKNNPHRLNPVAGSMKIQAATSDNNLFLVGNPFMAHLDMTTLLTKNADIIKPKYWILDGSHQGAVIMDKNGELLSTLDNPKYLAPMQAFFVEAVTPCDNLILNYDYSMATTANEMASQEGFDLGVRSASPQFNILRISAMNSGSSALIAFDSNSDYDYNADEDVIFVEDASLDAPALVYTVAHDTATTINVMPEFKTTQIGLIAAEDKVTDLLFEGVDESMGLMLYNASDDSYTEIYDGMQYEVEGSTSGNLFIVDSIPEPEESEIEITHHGDLVYVHSAVGGLGIVVSDVSGRLFYTNNDGFSEVEFHLPEGIYIIEATDKNSKKTMKLYLR